MTQVVQPHTGATIKPGPMVTVVPERAVTDAQLADVASGSGLNAPFLADQLSGFVTHERMGGNLLRMLHSRTANPMFQAMYAELLASCTGAVETWERLITDLGGNPQYASPAARLHEGMDAKIVESLLLPGSADPLSLETAGLMAAWSALQMSLLHAECLGQFASAADDGAAKDAMTAASAALVTTATTGRDQVRKALDTSMSTQAKHPMAQKVLQGMEKATAVVKDKLR